MIRYWRLVLVAAAGTATASAGCGSSPSRDASGDANQAADARIAVDTTADRTQEDRFVAPRDAADGGGMACGFTMPNSASAGAPNAASYDTSAPGVVTDTVSGLMWERTLSGQTASLGCQADKTGYVSCPLRYAVKHCENNRLGGFSDWRLPTIVELISLVDMAVREPTIDSVAFPNTRLEAFWSSTRMGGRLDNAWVVAFYLGFNFPTFIDEPHHVRCVRTTGTPPPRCYAAASRFKVEADTVADAATGLIWQRSKPTRIMAWPAANAYCEGMGGGFRLPTWKELTSIIDFQKSVASRALHTAAFPQPDTFYWSSTMAVGEYGQPSGVWTAHLEDGNAGLASMGDMVAETRCVR